VNRYPDNKVADTFPKMAFRGRLERKKPNILVAGL
jgi:hypothetical protein